MTENVVKDILSDQTIEEIMNLWLTDTDTVVNKKVFSGLSDNKFFIV